MSTKRIYEVLYDTAGEGPAGDGTVVARFSAKAQADSFALRNTCYGRPCSVQSVDVSRALARRWGF